MKFEPHKNFPLYSSYLPVFMNYRVLVHSGNVVMVEGRIMYSPSSLACALSHPQPLLHCPSALTNPINHVMHKNWYMSNLMLLPYPKQLLVFEKCAISR